MDPNDGVTLCSTPPPRSPYGNDTVAYNAVGNIVHINGVNPTYNKNRLTGSWPKAGGGTIGFGVNTAGDRVGKDAGGTYSTYYRWTPDGLLDTVRVGSPLPGPGVLRRIKYDYNAFGQLVRRRVDSLNVQDLSAHRRHFVWDRDNLLAELNGNLTERRSEYAHYPGLDAPFAMLRGGTAVTDTQFIHTDP